MRRISTRKRPGGTTLWGFSLTQAFIAMAIVALAASVFLPAFQIQCAAAKRALEEGTSGEVAQGTTYVLPVP